MSRSRILATLTLGGVLLLAAVGAQASTITCESRNDAYQACPVDTSHGVRLTQQLSSQGCWQNDTWGYDRNRIWVDRGCRAQFQVGESSSSSSGNGDALAAAAVVGLAAAAIIASNQKDDHHNNKHNNNYDNYDNRYSNSYYDDYYNRHDDRYYSNTRYGYNGYGGDPRRIFLCESRNGHRNYCNIPIRGHVEVFKQRSSKSCTYGRSWGVNGKNVWVDDGCRADFAVY
ncbi:MAG: DUF3011 domain-containing protein [Steroidobacteraceae bacterium]